MPSNFGSATFKLQNPVEQDFEWHFPSGFAEMMAFFLPARRGKLLQGRELTFSTAAKFSATQPEGKRTVSAKTRGVAAAACNAYVPAHEPDKLLFT